MCVVCLSTKDEEKDDLHSREALLSCRFVGAQIKDAAKAIMRELVRQCHRGIYTTQKQAMKKRLIRICCARKRRSCVRAGGLAWGIMERRRSESLLFPAKVYSPRKTLFVCSQSVAQTHTHTHTEIKIPNPRVFRPWRDLSFFHTVLWYYLNNVKARIWSSKGITHTFRWNLYSRQKEDYFATFSWVVYLVFTTAYRIQNPIATSRKVAMVSWNENEHRLYFLLYLWFTLNWFAEDQTNSNSKWVW